jgi:hypothetical protein
MLLNEKVKEMLSKGLKLVPCLEGTKKPFIRGWEKKYLQQKILIMKILM